MAQIIPTEADRRAALLWLTQVDRPPLDEALASHALAARIEALEAAAEYFAALPANSLAFTNSEIATAIRAIDPTTIGTIL